MQKPISMKWKAANANAGDRGWEIFDERNRNQLCNDMTFDGVHAVMNALKVSQAASVLVAAKGRHNTMMAYKALESAVMDAPNAVVMPNYRVGHNYRVFATPREALYEAACAMDNQDVPLEDWPMRLIAALTRAGFAVVPAELPHDVLGRAAIAGVAETGNPKHAWDFLIAATRAA